MGEIKPTVGRIVHYKMEAGDQPLAAIIIFVHEDKAVDMADLVVFGEADIAFRTKVVRGLNEKQWSWPPKV